MEHIIEQKDDETHDYYIIDGKKEGEYIKYYTNGNISSKCNYIDDKREGEWKYYRNNGQLSLISNYINDKITDDKINLEPPTSYKISSISIDSASIKTLESWYNIIIAGIISDTTDTNNISFITLNEDSTIKPYELTVWSKKEKEILEIAEIYQI